MSPVIPVTGATDRRVERSSPSYGHAAFRVRALVRRIDAHSEQVSKLGAEVVELDPLDFCSVRSSLEGVETAYLVLPSTPEIVQTTGYFAQAQTSRSNERNTS
jgi:NAD(P)H dehydrogenase (quinone)